MAWSARLCGSVETWSLHQASASASPHGGNAMTDQSQDAPTSAPTAPFDAWTKMFMPTQDWSNAWQHLAPLGGSANLMQGLEQNPIIASVDKMWNANPLRDVVPVDWAGVAQARCGPSGCGRWRIPARPWPPWRSSTPARWKPPRKPGPTPRRAGWGSCPAAPPPSRAPSTSGSPPPNGSATRRSAC